MKLNEPPMNHETMKEMVRCQWWSEMSSESSCWRWCFNASTEGIEFLMLLACSPQHQKDMPCMPCQHEMREMREMRPGCWHTQGWYWNGHCIGQEQGGRNQKGYSILVYCNQISSFCDLRWCDHLDHLLPFISNCQCLLKHIWSPALHILAQTEGRTLGSAFVRCWNRLRGVGCQTKRNVGPCHNGEIVARQDYYNDAWDQLPYMERL